MVEACNRAVWKAGACEMRGVVDCGPVDWGTGVVLGSRDVVHRDRLGGLDSSHSHVASSIERIATRKSSVWSPLYVPSWCIVAAQDCL